MADKTIGEVVEEGRLRSFMDRRLVKALGHPVREHILLVLNERIASPSDIGREIGLDVEDFYHHFEVLEELGCIERVEARRRRGATEHFYRAKECLLIDDSEWAQLPETLKSDLSLGMVKPIFDDVVAAMRGRTFDARDDRHSSWVPGYLDEQGWSEELALLKETLMQSIEIQERSARRLAENGELGTRGTVAILGFETPDPRVPAKESAMSRRAVALARGRSPASVR